jgi:hypothetical protein
MPSYAYLKCMALGEKEDVDESALKHGESK